MADSQTTTKRENTGKKKVFRFEATAWLASAFLEWGEKYREIKASNQFSMMSVYVGKKEGGN